MAEYRHIANLKGDKGDTGDPGNPVRGQIPAEITALSQMNHADYNGLWQANTQNSLSDAPFEITQGTLAEIAIGSPANAGRQTLTDIRQSWWREANVGGNGIVSSWGPWRKYADLDDVAGAGADALRSRPNLADGRNIDQVRGVADAGPHRMPVTSTYGGTWPAGDRSDQQETLLVLPSGTDGQTCTQLILRYDQTWIRHAPGPVWGAWRALSSRPVVLSPTDNLGALGEGTYMTNLETTSAALGLPGGRNGVLTRTMPAASQYLDVFMTNLTDARPDFQVWVRGMNNLGAWTAWQRTFPVAVPPAAHAVVATHAASNWTAATRSFDKLAEETNRPTSTIKVLTAWTARKTVQGYNEDGTAVMDNLVTVTAADIAANPGGSGGVTFQAGDQISYRDLFHAMMLPSSNWAAEIIARAVGDQLTGIGTARDKFLDAMRESATEFGWTGHHITNPTGLGNGNQLSAAMLVQLMLAAGGDALLRGLMGVQERTITFQGPNARTQVIRNTTDPNGDIAFPEMIGAKTGSLDSGAHACLVMLWQKPDGSRAASALIGSNTENRFKDMRAIIDATIHSINTPHTIRPGAKVISSPTDFNAYRTASHVGDYVVRADNMLGGPPIQGNPLLTVEVVWGISNGVIQRAASQLESWWRSAASSEAWGEWKRLVTAEEVDDLGPAPIIATDRYPSAPMVEGQMLYVIDEAHRAYDFSSWPAGVTRAPEAVGGNWILNNQSDLLGGRGIVQNGGGISTILWDKASNFRDGDILTRIARRVYGQNANSSLVARVTHNGTTTSGYCAYLYISSGEVRAAIARRDNGVFTELTAQAINVGVLDEIWMRFNLDGGNLRLKAWKRGTREPSTWLLSAQDTTYEQGGVGFQSGTIGTAWDVLSINESGGPAA